MVQHKTQNLKRKKKNNNIHLKKTCPGTIVHFPAQGDMPISANKPLWLLQHLTHPCKWDTWSNSQHVNAACGFVSGLSTLNQCCGIWSGFTRLSAVPAGFYRLCFNGRTSTTPTPSEACAWLVTVWLPINNLNKTEPLWFSLFFWWSENQNSESNFCHLVVYIKRFTKWDVNFLYGCKRSKNDHNNNFNSCLFKDYKGEEELWPMSALNGAIVYLHY